MVAGLAVGAGCGLGMWEWAALETWWPGFSGVALDGFTFPSRKIMAL